VTYDWNLNAPRWISRGRRRHETNRADGRSSRLIQCEVALRQVYHLSRKDCAKSNNSISTLPNRRALTGRRIVDLNIFLMRQSLIFDAIFILRCVYSMKRITRRRTTHVDKIFSTSVVVFLFVVACAGSNSAVSLFAAVALASTIWFSRRLQGAW
jgi:hypothetical protein